MPDIYESFTEQENTSAALDSNRLVNFAYDDTAFRENITKWNGYYDYNAHNNIQDAPVLPEETLENGFGRTSGVFKRTFVNHYLGRISYNLNKAIQAIRSLLGSFRSDYSENISEYSERAGYSIGDVCYRLSGDEINFYRCKAKIAAPAGSFNGIYWDRPEEELSHDRPVVGVPVPWFEKVPDWAIRFDDGAHHTWEECPALNFDDFKALVTLTDDGFTVPDFRGRVPMFTGGSNSVKSGYVGNVYTACIGPHTHAARALAFTMPATSISHTHDNATSNGSGNHKHTIVDRCEYDGADNRWRLPVDDISDYNPATLTSYAGSHSHTETTTSGGVPAHSHTVTVTGQTGGVKESTGGNPDSFQSCWIVRYR